MILYERAAEIKMREGGPSKRTIMLRLFSQGEMGKKKVAQKCMSMMRGGFN